MEEEKVLDFDECTEFIHQDTGIDQETINRVLDSETRFMIKVGIITVGDEHEDYYRVE